MVYIYSIFRGFAFSGVTRGQTAPGDTLQGVTPEGKKIFVGKFTKNSGETRSDRQKRCGATPSRAWHPSKRNNKKLTRRWDSERELSLRRHCTRRNNTIDSCINSATDGFLQHRFAKFSEIAQCNGHHAVQGHSRSPILVPIESSYTTSY